MSEFNRTVEGGYASAEDDMDAEEAKWRRRRGNMGIPDLGAS